MSLRQGDGASKTQQERTREQLAFFLEGDLSRATWWRSILCHGCHGSGVRLLPTQLCEVSCQIDASTRSVIVQLAK
jgi:hypothetical protein